MKKKIVTLSLLTLGICSVVNATEYKSPEVGFKARAVPSKMMKVADFGDHYKVESGVETDRQIASEDREPSSVVAKEKKKKVVVPDEPEAVLPKPWLHKNQDAGH